MSTQTRTGAQVTPAASRSSNSLWSRLSGHLGTTLHYGVLILFLFLTFFIFALMISLSLRRSIMIYIEFWSWPWPLYWDNYQTAMADLIPSAIRTLIVTGVSILGILVISSLAAYAFSRIQFPGREILFYLVLSVMMIPGVILLTPHFILANDLSLRGSLWGLVIFYVAGGLPFGIFLITTFFRSQPAEIFEAARIDGASEWQSLIRIALPLAFPILVTVAIMNFVSIYSDFIWPSLMLPQDKETIMLALERYNPVSNEFSTRPDLGKQTAGYIVATLPQLIVFSVGMKYFIKGVTSGAVKA
ncbi:MAG: carbohydrate ABC transporter permease [Chloroflexota bacterium]|nr:carbohydrate ABC transporter permease [Chloroflexota bacterium]